MVSNNLQNNINNKSSKTFIISDNHFGHKRIITDFCFRPKNFEKLIIKNWQNTVNKNDIVYDIGDVTWGSQEYLTDIMKQLPGTKILIRGNHDKSHSNNWFIQSGFSAVLEKAQISGIILSHFPAILNKEEIDRGIINVHGHFHNNDPKRWEKELVKRITENHYLFALEYVNYTPISIEMIRKRRFVKNSKELIRNLKEEVK